MDVRKPTTQRLPSASDTPLQAAQCYTSRGWRTVPVPTRSKNPALAEWPQLRLGANDLPRHFNGAIQNIGILLGKPSGGLIDVDLDHPLAVTLAPQFLPPTPLRFGRRSNPESHWIYISKHPVSSRVLKSVSAGTIIELRSTRLQTVFPPSIHECGELIEFVETSAEPAAVDPEELVGAITRLHEAVLAELGEECGAKVQAKKANGKTASLKRKAIASHTPKMKCAKAKAAMLACTADHIDKKDGSNRLIRCARVAVQYDLTHDQAVATILSYAKERPFKKNWTPDEITTRIRQAEAKAVRGSALDSRCRVIVDADESRVVDEVLAAIESDDALFVRGGNLVHVAQAGSKKEPNAPVRHEHQPVIRPIEQGFLRTVLSRNVNFVKYKARADASELTSVHVPDFVTRAIHSCGSWRNPVIDAVTQCPFVTQSGRLVTATGFDHETSVFLECGISAGLPSRFTHRAAVEAADNILDLFCDFPFSTEADRAAALAAVLTEFGKQAYEGPTPPFVLDANASGAGKGMVVDLIHAIQFAHPSAVSTFPESSEELQKVITTMAIAGDPTVFFDNVDSRIGGSHLEAAATATFWSGRILGSSRTFRGTFRPTWYFSGNNVRYRGDMPRRVVPIRLTCWEERPEEREGFKFPNLIQHAIAHRPMLASQAVIILKAFMAAGRPQSRLPSFGSFAGWSDYIRQCVVWCDCPDPCESARQLRREDDEQTEALRCVLASWDAIDPEDQGKTAQEIARLVNSRRELLPFWLELCDCREVDVDSRQIGWAMRRNKCRVIDGRYLDERGKDNQTRSLRWRRLRRDREQANGG